MLNLKSALVSGVIMGVLAMATYIVGLGDVFKIDVHSLVNVGALAVLTAVVSLIKSYLTTSDGAFLGVQIK